MSSLDEITKIRTDDRTHARGFTFSLKLWLQSRSSWTFVENLPPCNKVVGKFFLFTNRHTQFNFDLLPSDDFIHHLSLRFPDNPSPFVHRSFSRFPPNLFSLKPVFPSNANAHKKYNIFLSFDPATSSSLLPCPRSLSTSVRLFVCLAGSVSLIRRGSPDASRNRSRSGRLDCFVLWDSNMNYKPAPWLLHSRSLILPGPLSHRISLSTARSHRELGRMYKYGILLPETHVKIKGSLFIIPQQYVFCIG